jgi:hypothetical protein
MKTKILKNRLSFELMKAIMTTLLFLIIQGMSFTNVFADELPFDQNEVQKLRAFLASQSMTPGKTNADLLGMDINNPGTWAKWGGNDLIPRPSTQNVVDIRWKHHSLAGSLDISDFQSLGYFEIDCSFQSKFNDLRFRNNKFLSHINLQGVTVNELLITENGLQYLELSGKVDVLTLNQPQLRYLNTNTLGNIPLDLSKFTSLFKLVLSGCKNLINLNLAYYPDLEELDIFQTSITQLDATVCPKLNMLVLRAMVKLQIIKLKGESLNYLEIENTPVKELDLSGVPKLVEFYFYGNTALNSLKITNKNILNFLEVKGNQALRSLEISGSDYLNHFRCHYNENLEEIILKDLPKLGWIMAFANAFKKVDISGLPAIKDVWLSDNQLTEFKADGVVLEHLDLKSNKLTEVSANVGGHKIHLKAYGKGGYVGFDAGPSFWKPYGIQIEAEGLPAPYNTTLEKVEGTGFPLDENDYEGGFLLDKDIHATFFFKADIYYVNYFGDLEGDKPDEDEGEWDSDANLDYQSIVGEPFKLPEIYPKPFKTGYEIHGWYSDSTLTHEWNFEKDTVRGLLILYPKWIPAGMPTVMSVKRQSPTDENTSTNKVTYLVTFSKTVSGVDISDFKLTTEGTVTGKIASVSAANGNTISVEVNTIAGTGTLRLDVKNTGTGIVDSGSNPLAGGYTSGELYRVGPTTGISDPVAINSDCTIFPNPTTGKVNFTAPENETFSRIEVFNIQGKQVLLCDHPGNNDLDLSGLKTGIYLLRLSTAKNVYLRKVIKN